MLRKYAKFEPYNHLGRHMLLEAKLSDLYGLLNEDTYLNYVGAIATTVKSESLLPIAITNEVTAKYIVRNHGKQSAQTSQDAKRYFNDAIATYRQWGAIAKVRHLEHELHEYSYKI
jgi:hypothetical protein